MLLLFICQFQEIVRYIVVNKTNIFNKISKNKTDLNLLKKY